MRRLFVAVLLGVLPCLTFADVPSDAHRHRAELVRNARLIWGLDAPTATFAAQIHQESAWQPAARSRYAHGLAQFTPATAAWIVDIDPLLAGADAGNPVWAVRALVRYDRWLWERNPAAAPCDRMAFALAAYNGGEAWLRREQRQASAIGLAPDRWWRNVETTCLRAAWACQENRGYTRRILRIIEPDYVKAGWGLGMACS